jgi:hypothetical protein
MFAQSLPWGAQIKLLDKICLIIGGIDHFGRELSVGAIQLIHPLFAP